MDDNILKLKNNKKPVNIKKTRNSEPISLIDGLRNAKNEQFILDSTDKPK